MDTKPIMEYKYLGNSGLQVSAIGYGGGSSNIEQETFNNLIKRALELGINYFDTAERYGDFTGQAETRFGIALKGANVDREDFVISTKIFFGAKGDKTVNRIGLSRKHLIEGIKASLKRLQLDYVDVIMAHTFDSHTPMEETVRAFDWIVNNGYALYWGTSNWPAQKIEQAIKCCEQYGLIKPVVEQAEYSMLMRDKIEKEFVPLFESYKLGTTTYSPLAGGILTGKYNKEIPEGSRATAAIGAMLVQKYLKPEVIENTRKITGQLEEVAKELNISPNHLALAWVLKNKNVSTALAGATKVTQLEDNVKAIQYVSKITPEVEARINEILKNRPEPDFDFVNMKPSKPSRDI